ncbi:MAG: hypothetical protein IJV22_05255, partial [Bacteroidales bacterium]|nr:hypothetical protein [Bacteroidales bacterium]
MRRKTAVCILIPINSFGGIYPVACRSVPPEFSIGAVVNKQQESIELVAQSYETEASPNAL